MKYQGRHDDFSDGDNSDDIDNGDKKANGCTEIVDHTLFRTQSLTIWKHILEDKSRLLRT